MPNVTGIPPNIFSDPSTLTMTGNLSVPTNSKFVVVPSPDASGYELTVPAQATRFIVNSSAFDVTLVTTGNPNSTLSSGDATFVMWDIDTAGHVTTNVTGATAIQPIIYSQTALPASGSSAGLYSVQQGTDRGLYMSSGVGPVHLIHAYTTNGVWPV